MKAQDPRHGNVVASWQSLLLGRQDMGRRAQGWWSQVERSKGFLPAVQLLANCTQIASVTIFSHDDFRSNIRQVCEGHTVHEPAKEGAGGAPATEQLSVLHEWPSYQVEWSDKGPEEESGVLKCKGM